MRLLNFFEMKNEDKKRCKYCIFRQKIEFAVHPEDFAGKQRCIRFPKAEVVSENHICGEFKYEDK